MSIDPRGPRFGAAITSAVLIAVLLTGSGWLLAAQTAVFAVGAFAGPALAAAFLNAAFDYCLGCEVYLLFRRSTPRRHPVGTVTGA